MVLVRELWRAPDPPAGSPRERHADGERPLLTILQRRGGTGAGRAGGVPAPLDGVEVVSLTRSGSGPAPDADAGPPDVRRVDVGPDRGLPALDFDRGLEAARGRWIWCWDEDDRFDPADVSRVVATLSTLDSAHLLWLLPQGDPLRAGAVTIDELLNGLVPHLSSLIWHSAVFDRWGVFDPHIAVRDAFAYEMLLRTYRHVRVQTLPTQGGKKARRVGADAVDVVLHSDARTVTPRSGSLGDYDLADLSHLERLVGPERAWRLYLSRILPYYYRYRHALPGGLLIAPQSHPRSRLAALFTKVQYETSNELTFWNYARRFRGRRHFAFSYLQSEMLRHDGSPTLEIGGAGAVDVVVSTRTADAYNAHLVERLQEGACATAYQTDDDMLHFYEYGESFASLAPGTPHHDAMVEAIRRADVVIGFSDQIEASIQPHNPRYVSCEDSVPAEALPVRAAARETDGVFRFGYAGGGYRTEEFRMLRPAIERITRELGPAVRFEFWGMKPEDTGIGSAVHRPFSTNYHEYLERLGASGFDAMLVPLMREPAAKRAKNPNKFLEACVADAVGLYSDVPSYRVVRDGVTGLKVAESSGAWYEAMKSAIALSDAERLAIRTAALEYVRAFHTTEALASTTEAGIVAARLHHRTRHKRGSDGRPALAIFLPCVSGTGGGEIQLWRRFAVARRLGLRLLVVIAKAWQETADAARVTRYLDSIGVSWEFVEYDALYVTPETDDILPKPGELSALRDFFGRRGDEIALVHSLAFLPAVGMVCREFGLPHVGSIYGIADDYALPGGALPFLYADLVQSDSIRYARRWSELLGCPWICTRETVPAPLYELGFDRLFVSEAPPRRPLRLAMVGTFMERKSQLEVLRALSRLAPEVRRQVEFHAYGGVDVYAQYGAACREEKARAERAGATVHFHGHVPEVDRIYESLDVVLSVSTFESFPSAIKEATAAGCLVVASRAGGITEMMVDGVNALLVGEPTVEELTDAITRAVSLTPEASLQLRRNAFRLSRDEFHPRQTLHDLATTYDLCLDLHGRHEARRVAAPGRGRRADRDTEPAATAEPVAEVAASPPAPPPPPVPQPAPGPSGAELELARLAVELAERADGLRQGRLHRLRARFARTRDLWPDVSPLFDDFKRHADRVGLRGGGFKLQVGPNIRRRPYRCYEAIPLCEGLLVGLRFAPVIEVPQAGGTLGVELLTSEGVVLARSSEPVDGLRRHHPIHFCFPGVRVDSRPRWRIRLFAAGPGAPIAVFELRRYGYGGIGPERVRPFCSPVLET